MLKDQRFAQMAQKCYSWESCVEYFFWWIGYLCAYFFSLSVSLPGSESGSFFVVIDFEIWNTFLDLIFFQTGTRLPVGSGNLPTQYRFLKQKKSPDFFDFDNVLDENRNFCNYTL